MIVPMKKASIIVQEKDAQQAASCLRSVGVLHVEHQAIPKSAQVDQAVYKHSILEEALNIISLDEFRSKKISSVGSSASKQGKEIDASARHVVESFKRIQQLKEYTLGLTRTIHAWDPWGDFDPRQVRVLQEQGIALGLYIIPANELKKIAKDCVVKIIARRSGVAYCAIIAPENAAVPFKKIELPDNSAAQMREKLLESEKVIASLAKDISRHAGYRDLFLKEKQSLEYEIEFNAAVAGMGSEQHFKYMSGYVPRDALKPLHEAAEKNQWALLVRDPLDDERVPTLLRNPRWVSLIQPLFKAIEIVPGYREFDSSVWFLIFLSIFFGMLIGDAAYGLIFFSLTAFVHYKNKARIKDATGFKLMYLFSACAIVWGLFTGTFFGQAWLPAWVRPLFPALHNDAALQTLCFFLGALHLSIAHAWRAVLKFPSFEALSDVGWVAILWGGYHLARTLIIGAPFPEMGKWLFIGGITAVIFFSSIKKNILKTVGSGLGNLALNIVNSFTDIVSYVRLFAVGLATVAVADSFNKMAMETGGAGGVGALALSAFILFIGHALNIILGPMSVLVHGVRLNVLEFSNHLDVKWSGFEYKPLQEQAA